MVYSHRAKVELLKSIKLTLKINIMQIFGILNSKNEHIDVSLSLHGVKCYATRNGYKNISVRHGYNVVKTWSKIKNKWVENN